MCGVFSAFRLSPIPAGIKEILIAIFAYVRDRSCNLRNFTESEFYRTRRDNFCWTPISMYPHIWLNTRITEIPYLALLATGSGTRCIFEFGTCNGFSTVHLARNVDDGGNVFTLDLPPNTDYETLDHLSASQKYEDVVTNQRVQADGTGRHFVGKDAYSHVTQLFGDTMTFDYSPWHGKVGLCFVDAGHSYEYVKSDTENAFRMLADDGIIVWHDFDILHRDIYAFLNGLSKDHRLYYIENTSLAVYFKAEDSKPATAAT